MPHVPTVKQAEDMATANLRSAAEGMSNLAGDTITIPLEAYKHLGEVISLLEEVAMNCDETLRMHPELQASINLETWNRWGHPITIARALRLKADAWKLLGI